MNVLEAIETRRAVRSYSGRIVDEATIRSLLRAAIHAPSAMNTQGWLFGIVQNAALLKRWSDRAKTLLVEQAATDAKARHYRSLGHLTDANFNIFYDAGTLVAIGSPEHGTYADADCWLAAQNFMLAACEAGLGTCPIGFAVQVLNTPEAKSELRLPPSGVVVAPIIVGYPAGVVSPVPRAEPRIVSWVR